jgi:hypothetical protein
MVLSSFPSVNCEEVHGRIAAGAAGVVVYCIGVPLLATVLLVKYKLCKFKSSLSYFLVRAIFSGHNATATGMAYRVWILLRTFLFTAISLSELTPIAQGLGILVLVIATLLFESIADPRTTHFMSVLGCLEEVVVSMVVCVGIWQTGTSRGMLHSIHSKESACVRFP